MKSQDGFGYYQVNQKNGRRIGAADAYLKRALKRPNLRVLTDAHVLRVDLDGRRAVGVTARVNGSERSFRAQGEVILAAGAAQTPQLMELSGIGSPEILRKLGIGVNHALPGVGEIIPITSAPA